jgi:UPF0755 protein
MRRLRTALWIAWIKNSVLFLIIASTFYALLAIETPQTQPIKKITIDQNATSASIIAYLYSRGYNVSPLDQLILSIMGGVKKGEVRLKKEVTNRIDFLYQLTNAKPPLLKITLIPGETKELFFDLVAKKLDINATKLHHAYNTHARYPEASIAADTYLVPHRMNEEKLIKFLLASSQRSYKKMAIDAYGEYNQTKWLEILIVASIIQKEAANKEEMPLIASVIYNRLKKRMRLQMDGTLNYGYYSHDKITPKRIRTDKSRFNTYKYHGLPLSPIGSVEKQAIESAITPAKSQFLYFMRNKEGTHSFSKTFKEHRKHIKKMQ